MLAPLGLASGSLLVRCATQAEALDPDETVLGTLEKAAPTKNQNELKALLGRFQFQVRFPARAP